MPANYNLKFLLVKLGVIFVSNFCSRKGILCPLYERHIFLQVSNTTVIYKKILKL